MLDKTVCIFSDANIILIVSLFEKKKNVISGDEKRYVLNPIGFNVNRKRIDRGRRGREREVYIGRFPNDTLFWTSIIEFFRTISCFDFELSKSETIAFNCGSATISLYRYGDQHFDMTDRTQRTRLWCPISTVDLQWIATFRLIRREFGDFRTTFDARQLMIRVLTLKAKKKEKRKKDEWLLDQWLQQFDSIKRLLTN